MNEFILEGFNDEMEKLAGALGKIIDRVLVRGSKAAKETRDLLAERIRAARSVASKSGYQTGVNIPSKKVDISTIIKPKGKPYRTDFWHKERLVGSGKAEDIARRIS